MKNKSLNLARTKKDDEFYTQLSDISNELKFYKKYFKSKIVYCNCDDPRESNFYHYFSHAYKGLGLKGLVVSCYKSENIDLFSKHDSSKAVYAEWNTDKGKVPPMASKINKKDIKFLKTDGDFRNDESIEILKKADIICTNPPFSLFREYVAQLIKYSKKFIIIGPLAAATTKEIFPYIKNNQLWLGQTSVKNFARPDGSFTKMGNVVWYTNTLTPRRNEKIILHREYNPKDYLIYDNYNAINVDKVVDIPIDYKGEMGVPGSFLTKCNPDQFKIIGLDLCLTKETTGKGNRFYLNGERKYVRIIIKHKKAA